MNGADGASAKSKRELRMKHIVKFGVAVKAILLGLVLSTGQAHAKAPFPDLVTIDGIAVTDEADVDNGKWTLVMIWQVQCPICKDMKPLLSDFHDRHKDVDAQVYGVSIDGVEKLDAVKKYMIDHEVSFPTYVGDLALIGINFAINAQEPFKGTPTYMLFDPNGNFRAVDESYLDIESLERFISTKPILQTESQ